MSVHGPELKVRRHRAMSGLDLKADNPNPSRKPSSEPIVKKLLQGGHHKPGAYRKTKINLARQMI